MDYGGGTFNPVGKSCVRYCCSFLSFIYIFRLNQSAFTASSVARSDSKKRGSRCPQLRVQRGRKQYMALHSE